ncbi:xanthine dehydrogenase family protein subunit M [Micromonospora globbae]|uniref:Xanthine dehydrogenase family protein subunit M n=1 Tax=Micromonospora globbae TaxID=1894969 RepID=A0A420EVT9_9ACTN|nr:xanthine dehydrogenase family protein subunit M [Micromonospora globbae]
MIPASVRYHRAADLAEALELRRAYGDLLRPLAGGQSLLPALKLRRDRVDTLLDLGRIGELSYVAHRGDHLAVGALTRYQRLLTDPLVDRYAPMLATAAAAVGDPQVRHAGTVGGALAQADPAADLPLALVALDAVVVLASTAGTREVPAAELAVGPGATLCRPDELVTEVRVPLPGPARWSYRTFARPALEWSLVAVAVADGRVALAGMGPTIRRARGVEAALADGAGAAAAAARADEDCDPVDDVRASAAYRRHLSRVLVARALADCSPEVRP